MEWARLEETIEATIWEFLRLGYGHPLGGKHPIGMAVTTHMPFRVRVDVMGTLTTMSNDATLLSQMKSLIDRINKCHGDRNQIIHSGWTAYPKATVAYRHTARQQIKSYYVEYKIKDLNSVANEISRITDNLEGLRWGPIHRLAMSYELP